MSSGGNIDRKVDKNHPGRGRVKMSKEEGIDKEGVTIDRSHQDISLDDQMDNHFRCCRLGDQGHKGRLDIDRELFWDNWGLDIGRCDQHICRLSIGIFLMDNLACEDIPFYLQCILHPRIELGDRKDMFHVRYIRICHRRSFHRNRGRGRRRRVKGRRDILLEKLDKCYPDI